MQHPDIDAGARYLRARFDGSWDVCKPITGVAMAEVAADPDGEGITVRGDAASARAGAAAVRRYLLQLVTQPGE